MPTFSSLDFFSQWRFSLTEDFNTDSGDAFPYAEGGRKEWGDEIHKITYPDTSADGGVSSRAVALSHDGQHLAISSGRDILVYSTTSYELIHRLRGHVDDVSALAFRPGDSDYLVSSSANRAPGQMDRSLTYFWDLNKYQSNSLLDEKNTARISLAAVKSAVTEIETLSLSRIAVTGEEETFLAKHFEPHIARLMSEKMPGTKNRLEGSVHHSCKANAFSASGHAMFYLPNGKRRSNGYDEGWQLGIYSPDQRETLFMLIGHTDSIMWTGFNHDETLIGTCGWDKSIRIWNAFDGSQKYKFAIDGQGWAGSFSPDGKYFIGTCGTGKVHVYNLANGTVHMTIDSAPGWHRALAWHPSGSWFAVGSRGGGKLCLYNINSDEPFQSRKLGSELSKTQSDKQRFLDNRLEVSAVNVVDGGKKIVLWVSGDGSVDIYDLEKQCKWRFARAGTMNEADNEEPVTSDPGSGMRVWEDHRSDQVKIATINGDAIRFWAVPLAA